MNRIKYSKELIAEIMSSMDEFHAKYPIIASLSEHHEVQSPIPNHVVNPTTTAKR